MNGEKLWPRIGVEIVLPLPMRIMLGRPKKVGGRTYLRSSRILVSYQELEDI